MKNGIAYNMYSTNVSFGTQPPLIAEFKPELNKMNILDIKAMYDYFQKGDLNIDATNENNLSYATPVSTTRAILDHTEIMNINISDNGVSIAEIRKEDNKNLFVVKDWQKLQETMGFEDANISSYASNGEKIKYDVRRQMTALSLEVGKQIKHPVPYGNIIIEPKAEMGYGFSRAVSATTNIGTRMKYDDLKTLSGKIALILGYERYLCNAQIIEPYLHFGVLREFDGKTNITYAGAGYESNLGGTSYEFGGGLNFKSSTNTALYSEFMYEKGSIIESLSTNLGFRYSW